MTNDERNALRREWRLRARRAYAKFERTYGLRSDVNERLAPVVPARMFTTAWIADEFGNLSRERGAL